MSLKEWWSWYWKTRFADPYYGFMCRVLKKHEYVLYSVGHNYGKECRHCFHPGLLSEADIDEITASHPRYDCMDEAEEEVAEDGPETY